MKKKPCSKPATVMAKLGTNPEVPLCEAHTESARGVSFKAGQVKGVDKMPVLVRPLSETEKANKPRCLISSLGA